MSRTGADDPLAVRLATQADAPMLLAWRNDPEVRGWSRSSDPIDPATHAQWLARSLASGERHLLVVQSAATAAPVATTRYDLLSTAPGAGRSRWEVSIAVAPGMRGRGVGGATLEASDAWLFGAEPEATEIVAWVRSANGASRRLFERHGYRETTSTEDDMNCYVRSRPAD
jgi:RimJ/RimL family protein N-acetyltransferase